MWGAPPYDRIVAAFIRFEALEKPTETEYRAALDELRSYGLRTRETARKGLDSPRAPTVRLAARLLEFVGKVEDAPGLVEAASGVGDPETAGDCLETALRLNGGWLPADAVRLLQHPTRNVRGLAESRLARMPRPEHVRPLLQLVRYGRDADTRIRAARLLADQPGEEGVRPALRSALMDESMEVAFAAAEGLAGAGRPEETAFLKKEILAAAPGPELGYLLWALLVQQGFSDRLLITEDLEPGLKAALAEPDPFLSGTAAACLAEFGFRSPRAGGFEYLDEEVPFALVRAVGGVTYFPHFSRLAPLAEKSLSRISGEEFDEKQPGLWVDWFAQNHGHFRAVRAALSVSPGDLARLQVSWRSGEGGWRRMGGKEAGLEEASGSLRVLGPRNGKELFALLEADQLLDSSVLPGTYGPFGDPVSSEIEIHVGRRRKRFLFRGGSNLPWLNPLLERLEALWQTTQWELLAPEGQEPARSKFVLDHLDRWDAATKAEREALMVSMTRGNLAPMDDESLRSWSATLAAYPGLEGRWDLDLAREFLEELPARAAHPEVAETVLRAGLREPDSALTPALLQAAEPLKEPLRSDLLLEGLSRLGAAVCSDCLKDPHLAVRVAAARALGRAGSKGRSALLTALKDSNPLVVRMAVRSLGEQEDPSVLPSLLPLAGPTLSKDVRREALWALGEIGDPQGLAVVLSASRDPDSAIRLAAIRALGKLSGQDVGPAFQELFPVYAGTPLEVSFLRSLSGRGAEAARQVLRPHLLSQDKLVVRRAALRLGALGDPAASPELISLLPDTPHDEELLDALVYCLCVDFRQMPDPAGNYAAWWRQHGGEDPRLWFNREAVDLGWVIPEGFLDDDPASRAASVEALLKVLEEGPAHLHPAAAYHLQRLTGVDGPAIQGRTPKAVVRNLAASWHQWLNDRG